LNDARDKLEALLAPHHSAVLVQELQEGVVGPASRLPALAAAVHKVGVIRAARIVTSAARCAGVPVIHCTAENLDGGFGRNANARVFVAARRQGMANLTGSASVRPLAQTYDEGDLVLPRYHGLSPMTGTTLDSLLRNQSIRTLVVLGVSLNLAIPNLVFDAVNRSYQVVLVEDGVVGVPVDYGKQVIEHSLSLVATVVTSNEVERLWQRSDG
jgi:nicotinamidase-related amidase